MKYEELDKSTKKWVDEKLATLSSEEEKNAFLEKLAGIQDWEQKLKVALGRLKKADALPEEVRKKYASAYNDVVKEIYECAMHIMSGAFYIGVTENFIKSGHDSKWTLDLVIAYRDYYNKALFEHYDFDEFQSVVDMVSERFKKEVFSSLDNYRFTKNDKYVYNLNPFNPRAYPTQSYRGIKTA